ncbi:hypothetical protein [Streptomyces paludis]|uniref:Uncharacterized protein n=1 Tax=Streptomyces paludis TaxID=2282738 RepID=A0A345HWR4_9ACTN|nr:hypothetical protein [Streptomyces paludis]AXG81138.1 hypothetical protein DVK44_29495 [Streptomyces paludis]
MITMKPTGFQLAALIVIIVGVTVLTAFGKPTGTYIALVTPILAAMYLDGRTEAQNQRLEEQDRQLAQITHQTNGILTERITQAVQEALDQREGRQGP